MATTAATTTMIVEVTRRQEEDNDADNPSSRMGNGDFCRRPSLHLYVILVFICNERIYRI